MTMKVFDAETYKEVRTHGGHKLFVSAVAYSPDGKEIVSAGMDGRVLVREAGSGTEIRDLSLSLEKSMGGGEAVAVESLAFTPDGKILLSGRADSNILAWDLSGGPGPFSKEARDAAAAARGMRTLRGHRGPVRAVAFSPDGKRLASGGYDNTIKIWDVETGTEVRTIWGRLESPDMITFFPDGKRLVAGSVYESSPLSIWDVEQGKVLKTFPLEDREDVVAMALDPDGRRLFTASRVHDRESREFSYPIRLWDVEKSQVIRTFRGEHESAETLALTGDGETLVTGGRDGLVRLWDVSEGVEKSFLRGHGIHVGAVAASQDGKWIASWGFSKTLRLWDVETLKEVRVIEGVSASPSGLAFSPNGKLVAAGIADFSVRIWDVETGEERETLVDVPEGDSRAGISAIAFSPDGKRIAAAGGDATVRLWPVP